MVELGGNIARFAGIVGMVTGINADASELQHV